MTTVAGSPFRQLPDVGEFINSTQNGMLLDSIHALLTATVAVATRW